MNALDERGRFLFNACKDFAELLAPIAGRKGFFAFDCAERLGLWRAAAAAGIITEEEFWQKARPLASAASDRYDGFLEYAAGYLVRRLLRHVPGPDGPRKTGWTRTRCASTWRRTARVLEQLLTGPWQAAAWYKRPPKQYKLNPGQLRPVLTGYEGGDQGGLHRQRPDHRGRTAGGLPVPGAAPGPERAGQRLAHLCRGRGRRLHGGCRHFEFYHLNTICNYDASILELLNAPGAGRLPPGG